MSGRVLVDTNILVYAYDLDAGEKRAKEQEIIYGLWQSEEGVLTTQVLAEFFVTITRKVKNLLSFAEARQIIDDYKNGWSVFATTPETVLKAIQGVEQYSLSFWDSMIWASAVLNGVAIIYSEDMQHEQLIEGIRIENPLL
jgi:predicted nucleic acid-binding protein